MGAIVALVAPVLLLGPWLPLIDLVGFVGMYSYPPQLSYGPLHHYVFQFSYVGVLALSRLCCDLLLPIRFQIPLLYLLQVGICFGVVYGSLQRLVRDPWLRAVGIALGALAFWDGIFLWGGPLAHSMGAAFISWATYLSIRDAAESGKNASTPVTLLVLFGICCHPFMLPFALVLCGVRFLFDPARRRHTVFLAALVLVFGFVIFRDSPAAEVGDAEGGLRLLFGFHPAEIWLRLSGLFTQDARFATALFGSTPSGSLITFFVFAILHLVGFVLSPYIAVKERQSTWLRMLATLNTCAGVLYVFSRDLPSAPIGEWPQRVLTLYAPYTYMSGFVGLLYVMQQGRGVAGAGWRVPRVAWLVPGLVLAFAVFTHAQVFRFGSTLAANIAKTRDDILKTGVTNAYLVVSGMDNVHPFYLRAVPFVLFSDREIVARNLLLSTEWHVKPRHPTRLAEAAFQVGRKHYLAEFSAQGQVMAVQLIEQPSNRFPVSERTNATTWMTPSVLAHDQFHLGVALFQAGVYPAAFQHFNTAVYLQPDFVEAWTNAGAALFRAGNPQDAMLCFEAALQRDPKSVDAHMNLALVMAELGRSQEAVTHAEEVLAINPGDARALTLLQTLRPTK
ncbi:hypothetical protein DB354_01070 [Opitutus sp. ER46]|nr:hypothetical protein DB354_01070 [Opitutus sp. ER46]